MDRHTAFAFNARPVAAATPEETTVPDRSPDGSALVQVKDVHKWYGDLHVLRGITFDVQAGEVVCLVGPSGSGKSTLLRAVNHLESVSGGQVRVAGELVGYERGRDGKLMPASERVIAHARRRIGLVSQSYDLFWHMTLLENMVVAPVHVLGISREKAEAKARDLLARVGLSDKHHAYPRKLSGGQQQRGAIARALMMDPVLMLFDEPTSALDPDMTHEVLAVMEQLAAEGTTMVVVSHEVSFVRRAAHRVILMREGLIVEERTRDELLAMSPDATSSVAAFLAGSH